MPAEAPDGNGVAEVQAAAIGCPPGTTRQCVFDPEVRAWTCECVPTTPPPPPPPPPGSGAVSVADWTDVSGKVHVRVYQGPWSPVSSRPTAACLVEPDRVLVGGGAEIENGETRAPGALLVGSWPAGANPDDHDALTTWWAETKDHFVADPHRLRAYALGLKIDGFSQADLRARMYTVTVSSPVASQPLALAPLHAGADDLLVGGGARAFGHAGQLLVATHADASGASWFARSKDHGVSDPGTVQAIAIGIRRCLTVACLGNRCFQANCLQNELPQAIGFHVDTGYAAAIDIAELGAPTSFGAQAFFEGAGRLLTQITPRFDSPRGGMRALSKDHGYVDGGSNGAGALTLRMAQ